MPNTMTLKGPDPAANPEHCIGTADGYPCLRRDRCDGQVCAYRDNPDGTPTDELWQTFKMIRGDYPVAIFEPHPWPMPAFEPREWRWMQERPAAPVWRQPASVGRHLRNTSALSPL